MKVLHYSDKGVKDFIKLYKQCDILITTGDLRFTDFTHLDTYEPKKPGFGVYGNHDDGCNHLETNKIENVHNRVVEFGDLKIGGFQGSPRYNIREMQYTEREAAEFANNFPYVDILLLHAGPKGLLDDPSDRVHRGSIQIRRYVDEKKPRFIFCGHQYTNDKMIYGQTHIYRTYGARFIEIEI